ncbi:ATP-dependent zinc protease family protein [Halomonas getboli]|uniref:retropepsin-like aspartic peptidase RloA3 n=1 Tax=Halomonas getboli TaxID=2935862 RepID=UPI001FFE3A54|nr:RimK/LysX family protein [Halomonas getboli]MCK2182429.1 RimK/LysX family protein [Halomonas getboli]
MRTSLSRFLMPLLGAGLMSGTVLASDADSPEVYGWVEKTLIDPDWGVEVKAKLDSGALTSSMQAEHIEEFQRDGDDWVRFEVEVEDEESGEIVSREFERPIFRDLTVVGAGGRDHRPVVLMTICMGDERFEEQFSLEDRDDMNYPVLLGRRTIQSLGDLDVTETFLQSPSCNDDSPLHRHADKEYADKIGV